MTATAAPRPVAERAFAPEPPPARFAPSRGRVDPDRTKSWIGRLQPVFRSHQRLLLIAVIAGLLTIPIQIAAPRVVMAAIDDALIDRDHSLTPYVVALVALAAGRYVLGFVYRAFMQRASLAVEYDLRTQMFEQFSRLSFSYYDRVQTGQLVSRANSDIRAVERFLSLAPMTIVAVLTFIAAFVLMATINLQLALIAVATAPSVYFIGVRMRRIMFPVSWVVQARQADLATIVEENVTGTRVVKSFAAEEQQIRLLARSAERLRWAATAHADIRARYQPLLQNVPRLGFALVLLYGGHLAVEGKVTVGTLVAFNAYVVLLQMPFMLLGFLMMMGNRAAASAQRIFEVLDAAPEIVDHPGAVDLVGAEGDVVFDDVTFRYGDGPDVLSGLFLHLRPGETVAMVGRTGCGKSTVARLLPRFYDVSSGEVRIDGHDVRMLTLDSLRHHIGLVLDEPFLFSESIHENIAYGRPDAPMDEIVAAARAAGAEEFIDRLPDGYDTVVGERGYTLSGGQRQRIAIARTLLVNPRILILDDATSAVDVQVEQEIHDALSTLMQGRTTLIIAHRLSTISLADRVVLLENGRVVADGTHAELMRTVPAYVEVLARAEAEWQEAHGPHGEHAPPVMVEPPRDEVEELY